MVVGSLLTPRLPAKTNALDLTNVPYFGCQWRGEAVPRQLYNSADAASYLSGMRAVLHALRKRLRPIGIGVATAENGRGRWARDAAGMEPGPDSGQPVYAARGARTALTAAKRCAGACAHPE